MTTAESDRAAFMRAIIAEPENDLPRLVFADWLDEHGDPQGEFVRVQVELVGDDICPQDDDQCADCAALRRRDQELLNGVCGLGVDALPIIDGLTRTNSAGRGGYGWFRKDQPALPGIETKLRRGFVEQITCIATDFLDYADAIQAATPLRKVVITVSPEMRFRLSEIPLDGSAPTYQMMCVGRDKIITAPGDLNLNDARACLEYYLKAEFPRLTVELPPVVENITN